MAKRNTIGRTPAAKADNGGFIPPLYYTPAQRPANPDPPRGSVTEGKDITAAFTELIREATVCAYRMLRKAIGHFPQLDEDHWAGYSVERDALLKSYRSDGGSEVYGGTLGRVCRQLEWVAIVPRLCTDEEIAEGCRDCGSRFDASAQTLLDDTRRWCQTSWEEPTVEELLRFRIERYGLPDMADNELLEHFSTHPLPAWYRRGIMVDEHPATGPDDERFPASTITTVFRYATVTTDERNQRWIAEYVAEVEVCVDRFKDHDGLPHEVARLMAEVEAFDVGHGEARDFVAALRSTAVGTVALTKMQDAKARLLVALEGIREEYAPADTMEGANTPRFTWRGQVGELAEVFTQLAANGWIETPPRGRAKLARTILQTFKDTDGNTFDKDTLTKYMQPGAHRPVRDGWKCELSKRPEPQE